MCDSSSPLEWNVRVTPIGTLIGDLSSMLVTSLFVTVQSEYSVANKKCVLALCFMQRRRIGREICIHTGVGCHSRTNRISQSFNQAILDPHFILGVSPSDSQSIGRTGDAVLRNRIVSIAYFCLPSLAPIKITANSFDHQTEGRKFWV